MAFEDTYNNIKSKVATMEATVRVDKIQQDGILIHTVEDFLKLCSTLKSEIVFYQYISYDPESYLIRTDREYHNVKALNDEIINKIIGYNNSLPGFNSDEPIQLIVYQVCFGQIYFYYEVNERYLHLVEPDIELENIILDVTENISDQEINDLRNQEIKANRNQLSEVVEIITNHKVFQAATNEASTKEFAISFFDEYPEYYKVINKAQHIHPIKYVINLGIKYRKANK
ncbi:hypothetical protein SAMN05421503_1456 [Terribacillus aidingensis]|uniref:Uncharacterized protein n=1 Tax=Terribacillus aidingensis TaxID=586416 RepID=A0A285NQ68_9BACI|nr:hypothetical protein [Terribacillus aidingensis]SNZ09996.1 hypothetical protein SAMN05421503_1456 [Terribacillus aidingensis]